MIRGGEFQFFRKGLLKDGLLRGCAPLKAGRNQSRDVSTGRVSARRPPANRTVQLGSNQLAQHVVQNPSGLEVLNLI